jgi:hypothetical protein
VSAIRVEEGDVRQLRIPLQRDSRPRASGQLTDWGNCVRRSSQPCLLTAVDGSLIAVSERARQLLGDGARPGLPESQWWHELFPHSPAPSRERSLLARATASGTPTHSLIQLMLDGHPAMVQVLAAPLEDVDGDTTALLVFLQPVSNGLAAR